MHKLSEKYNFPDIVNFRENENSPPIWLLTNSNLSD